MRYSLDDRLRLSSVRKFYAQVIVGCSGDYLRIDQSNYAVSTTAAVMMFLKDCGVQKDYLYYFRVRDIDGVVTYWLAGLEPLLGYLVVKPCTDTMWREASAGVSNTRTNQRYLDSLGTGKKWGEILEALLSGKGE